MIGIYEDKECTKPLKAIKFGNDITIKLFSGKERIVENVIDIKKPVRRMIFLRNESTNEFLIQKISSDVKGFQFHPSKETLQTQEIASLSISHDNPEVLIKLKPLIIISGVFIIV